MVDSQELPLLCTKREIEMSWSAPFAQIDRLVGAGTPIVGLPTLEKLPFRVALQQPTPIVFHLFLKFRYHFPISIFTPTLHKKDGKMQYPSTASPLSPWFWSPPTFATLGSSRFFVILHPVLPPMGKPDYSSAQRPA